MFYEWINDIHHLSVPLMKALPVGWTSQQNITSPDNSFYSSSLDFGIITSVFAIFSMLIIRLILQWIIKYKLQYLFRISCFILICHSLALPFTTQKSRWILSAIFCFVMGVIRYHWAMPINIIQVNSNVGFSHLESIAKSRKQTMRNLSEKMLKHREPGELNPVYVNGWIPLIESRAVVKGKAVTVIAVGYKFCVYRGEKGQVFVLDAYCPHMGADLSAGGKIIGNCIECPFHGWQFDGKTGKCTKIPYSEKNINIANVRVWDSCEKNGYIFVWHHAENEPPTWELPSFPEIENGTWLYRGRSEFLVHCHIQEIPENGADIAHLPQLHSRFHFFGPETPGADWIQYDWKPQWSADENEPHVARVKIAGRLTFWGYELPYSRVNVDGKQIGPATVYLKLYSELGNGIFLQYITSEGPMLQRIVQEFYTEPKLKPGPALFAIWGEAKMVERDIAMWNNKKYIRNPLLVKEDKLILKFRRWYSQFYSEHSPTLKDLRERTLDW